MTVTFTPNLSWPSHHQNSPRTIHQSHAPSSSTLPELWAVLTTGIHCLPQILATASWPMAQRGERGTFQ